MTPQAKTTMSSEDVKRFNSLPRKKLAPSGLVPNAWHFDIRYIQLEPTPAHVLNIVQPESRYAHMEYLPAGATPGSQESFAFFPETAAQAAPEVAKALIRAFISGLGMGTGVATQAPWKLMTEDKSLATAVGNEFKRIGVLAALHNIAVSTPSTCDIALESFRDIFKGVLSVIQIPPPIAAVIQVPESMTFNYKVRSKPYDLRGTEEEEVILAYAQLLDNCRPFTPDKLDNQAQQLPGILANAQTLLQKSFADVEREVADNPSGLVDCAVRLYYGVGCRMDRKGAHLYLIKATFHSSANDTVKATAHAILAEWYTTASESLRSRYLYAGIHHANKAIQLCRSVSAPGYFIPSVLFRIRHFFIEAGRQFMELNFFYSDVWDAEKEAEERYKKDTETSVKRMKNPLRYRCATVGCGIEADHGKMLQKCGGKCDDDKKPYYCSRDCQKADWKNHKPFCKPGMPCSVIDSDAPSTVGMGGRSKDGAYSITVPRPGGGQTVVSSSTMTPEFMKEFRDAVGNMSI